MVRTIEEKFFVAARRCSCVDLSFSWLRITVRNKKHAHARFDTNRWMKASNRPQM